MGWTREVYRLPERHGWTATPGHRILVLDRGTVLLEFPADWTVEPGAAETRMRDGASAEVDLGPVWDRVLSSLRLGARLEDPTRGTRIG